MPRPRCRPTPEAWIHLAWQVALMAAFCLAGRAFAAASDTAAPGGRGMPVSRSYSYSEIGDLSPGVQLCRDPLGRLVVVEDGTYIVFDDKNWNDIEVRRHSGTNISRILHAPDGTTYYGAAAAWGTVEYVNESTIQLHPLRPADAPTWVASCGFDRIAAAPEGMYFGGTSGLVYWHKATGRSTFFAIPDIMTVFTLGGVGYVSSSGRGLLRVDLAHEELRPALANNDRTTVDCVVPWDATHVLGWSRAHGFVLFDGQRLTPWHSSIDAEAAAGVSRIVELPEGRLALLATGRGLFVIDRSGANELALTGGEYSAITDLCAGEPGVLWLAGADGVTKLLYDSPVSVFDHRLGLSLQWPWVGNHEGRTVVVTGGRLYEAIDGPPAEPTRFRQISTDLPEGVWSGGATPHGLLVGNSTGAYLVGTGGRTTPVIQGFNANRISPVSDDICLVIGEEKIAALRWNGSQWEVAAGPIPGAGFPSQMIQVPEHAAWIELGINRVARIAWNGHDVTCRVFDQFPWKVPVWLNLGMIGHTVVITHSDGSRLYFDEDREAFVDAPEIDRLLRGAPHLVLRPMQTADGAIWMAHARGVSRLVPTPDGYREDFGELDVIRETYPVIQVAGGSEVWISSAAALSRIIPRYLHRPVGSLRPVLTSVVDAREKRELYSALHPDSGALREIPYAANNLSFRFFCGTYRRLRPADYQYRIPGHTDDWSLPVKGSTISLTGLREGSYRMEVRLVDGTGPVGEPATFAFSIAPPLYRRWYAYGSYLLFLGVGLFLSAHWLLRRAARRTRELENIVNVRTEELRIAVEAGEIGTWRRDLPEGPFTLSERARRIFGIPPDEPLTYEEFCARFPADDQSAMAQAMHTAIAEHRDFKLDVRNVWSDKSLHWATLAGRGYYDAAGRPLYLEGAAIDVTDRRRVEHDRMTLGKLESTGLLAAGIAHDFNNLLAGVLLNAEMALDGGEREKQTALQFTASAVRSATELTRQLITFSAGGLPARRPVDLRQLVRDEAARWTRQVNVHVDVRVDSGVPRVAGDHELLAVALRNLLANASEASAPDQPVIITVDLRDVAEREIATLPAGGYVRISVTDSGRGIAPDVLPRIFDPYFSTKDRGAQKGMGLGLTIAMSVAQRHGGTVTVETAPEKGSTFHLMLPLVGGEQVPAPAEAPGARTPAPLRILVMDDETPLREALGRMIRVLGHEVETVSSGREAIEAYAQTLNAGRRFDLVILDLTVPGGVGGEETLRSLRAMDPNVCAIVTSGYAQSAVMESWAGHGFAAALVKPFTREMLVEALARAIASRPLTPA